MKTVAHLQGAVHPASCQSESGTGG